MKEFFVLIAALIIVVALVAFVGGMVDAWVAKRYNEVVEELEEEIAKDSEIAESEQKEADEYSTIGWYEVCTVDENGRTTHFESRDAKNAYERAVELYRAYVDRVIYIVRDERFIMTFCEHGELIEVAATPEEHAELLDCVHQYHKLGKYNVTTDDSNVEDTLLDTSDSIRGNVTEEVVKKIYTVNHWKNPKPVIATVSLVDCITIVKSLMAQEIDGIHTIWIASVENDADKLVAHFEYKNERWTLHPPHSVTDQERELLEKVC